MTSAEKHAEFFELGFGMFILFLGILNLIRGNDLLLGIMLILLSPMYFPAIQIAVRDLFAFSIPLYIKIAIALIIFGINLSIGAIAEGFYSEIITSISKVIHL